MTTKAQMTARRTDLETLEALRAERLDLQARIHTATKATGKTARQSAMFDALYDRLDQVDAMIETSVRASYQY